VIQRITGNRDTLLANVIDDAPDDFSVPEISGAMVGLMDRALLAGLKWGDDWTPIWPLTPERWRETMDYGILDRRPPSDPPKPDTLAGELLTIFADLGAELGTDMPCPPNSYLVGVRGEDLMVAMPVQGRISQGSALNLAVWLVALADRNLTRFAPMLAKVLQT
jgi:hypothetical protein